MKHSRHLGFVLGTILLATSITGAAAQEKSAEPIWPTRGWQTSTPEEQGMDSAALAKLVEFGTSRSFDSLLIARHGRIVLDAYYAPYSVNIPHVINSATKAVIGTLTGIAVGEGLLDTTDRKMMDFFSDRSASNPDDRKKDITLQHLLDMTSGIDWREPLGSPPVTFFDMERSPDWVKFVLDRPTMNAPGELFNYNSGGTHLVSAILTKLTGMSAEDYAKSRLFGPLGINIWKWRRDPQGNSTGGNGLSMLPRDMAKVGYLYLRRGEWEGKAIVPPAWVEKVGRATVNMNMKSGPEFRYSNFFWVLPSRNAYMAVGYHNQIIMVLPALDIVLVTTSKDFYSLSAMADYVAGAVKSEAALPPSSDSAALLAEAIRDISTEKPIEAGAAPELATAISGKTWQFPGNGLGLKSITLALTGPQPRVDFEFFNREPAGTSRTVGGPIGLDGVYRRGDTTPAGIAAVKGRWLDDRTFVIQRLLLGAGFGAQTYTLRFDDEKVNVRSTDRNGRDVSIDGGAWRKS